MTSVVIKWARIPFARKLFTVYHWRKPSEEICASESVLIIPDKWNPIFEKDTFYLLTETERMSSCFEGEGISVDSFPYIDDGDVVLYDSTHNRLELVYQVKSRTNALYVTNACNSRCQFCPQPSSNDDGMLYDDANRIVDLVKSPGECVNITGGEPTINKEAFLNLLRHVGQSWNATKVFVLTNGRNLLDRQFVSEVFVARSGKPIGFGIPLYADCACVHDRVVGVKGAFGQTIRGLYNLAKYHTEIEIRFVLSKLSYNRLPQLIEFIGRSVPFVTRVAVMGIEPMGYCRVRWNDFWIDPEDCHDILLEAARKADNYGVDMLLYNFQLCCIPASMRRLACVSISEWKRTYQSECMSCAMRNDCGGFFASQNKPEYLPRRFSCDEIRKDRWEHVKHHAPKADSPSRFLVNNYVKYEVEIADGVICDAACGYGRNGAFFVKRGKHVVFVDIDKDALCSVEEKYVLGKQEGSHAPFASVVNRNLISEGWIENPKTFAGVIMVHFYNFKVLRGALQSLVKGGFVYFETIDDRGNNFWELPNRNDILKLLETDFDVKFFKDRPSRKDESKITCAFFAIKK